MSPYKPENRKRITWRVAYYCGSPAFERQPAGSQQSELSTTTGYSMGRRVCYPVARHSIVLSYTRSNVWGGKERTNRVSPPNNDEMPSYKNESTLSPEKRCMNELSRNSFSPSFPLLLLQPLAALCSLALYPAAALLKGLTLRTITSMAAS